MSVLIPDMSIPKSCSKCRLAEGDTGDGICYAAQKWFDDEYFSWWQYPEGDIDDSKPANCPLVEIPEGRLFGIKDGVLYLQEVRDVNANANKYTIPEDFRLNIIGAEDN